MSCGLLVATGLAFYLARPHPPKPDSPNSYVDARRCQPCHAAIHSTYQHVGMARAFTPANRASAIENYDLNNQFVHAASGRHYQAVRRGGRIFQRRFELNPAGRQVNVFEMEATHAVGSGNHARTYLHQSEAGEFTELPLTWYSQEKRWAMSPGFDNASPPDFTRIVDDRCLFCHNGYPDANGKLAEGIDCQRCHGPGSRHIALASTRGASRPEILSAIVNPGKLSPDRQLDVCMQCHLETTSRELPSMIRRFNREVHSFRPGEALGAYAVQFEEESPGGKSDRFEIVNQAYRLRQSPCFVKSQGKLTCITCHNPHQRGSYQSGSTAAGYRAKCTSCHPVVASAGHPDLQKSDCISCHMVRRRAEDAVHVVMTDHRIQRRPPAQDLTKMLAEESHPPVGRPSIYYPRQLSEPDRGLYLGVALIVNSHGRRQGVEILERQLKSDTPPKAIAVLGEGYLAGGNTSKAMELFRQSLAKDPAQPKVRYNLGEALAAAGRSSEARTEYQEALRFRPLFPEAEYALANLLMKMGDSAGAIAHYRNAIRMRPNYAEARSNLGSLFANGARIEESRQQLEEALRINPALTDAYINMSRVLAAQHLLPEAVGQLRRALALDAAHAVARYNLAQLLQETGAIPAAIAEYRKALAIQPGFVEAHLGLAQLFGDAGQLDPAIAEFHEVLRLQPGHAAARQGLEMALVMKRGGR